VVKIRNAIVSAPMNFSIISAYKKPCVGRKYIFPCIRHMPKAILKGKNTRLHRKIQVQDK
jgi:hypothetical protein